MLAGWRYRAAFAVLSMFVVLAIMHAPIAGAVDFEFRNAFGPDGIGSGNFATAGSVAVDQEEEVVYVLDPEVDALFKFDFEGNPVAFSGSSPDIAGNKLSGMQIAAGLGGNQVAVDPESHTIYLTGENGSALMAFESNGDPAIFTAGPGAGGNKIDVYSSHGATVDASGNIYVSGVTEGSVSGQGKNINIYRRSGAVLLENAGGGLQLPGNMAVDSKGTIYVLVESAKVIRLTPSAYPIEAGTTYAKAVDLVDQNPALSLAVDRFSNQLYVLEFFPITNVARVASFSEDGKLLNTFGGPGEAGELERPSGIAVGGIEQPDIENPIAQIFVSNNPEVGLRQVEIFREEIVISAPSVESTSVSEVTGDSAVLRAKVNPNNRASSYWFEYGLVDCKLGPCIRVPLAGEGIGAGRRGVLVSKAISGLQSGAIYHYRVVAENELDTTEGPDRTFTTQGAGLGVALGDSRIWEMVSPPKKFGGSLANNADTMTQAGSSGNGLVYASRGSIVEDPISNRLPDYATLLAKRRQDGSWISQDLTPPHSSATNAIASTPFKLFTPDLLRAELEGTEGTGTPLSPEASEQTPYLWADGIPSVFTPIVTAANVPPGTKFGPRPGGVGEPVRIEGASSDLKHVVVSSQEAPLVLGAAPKSIYQWSAGGLEAVSELPESEGGEVVAGMLGSGQGSIRHAVSSDGSRIFWASTLGYGTTGISLPALYLRDTVGKETIRLDVPVSGDEEGEAHPAFNLASSDGRVVFFTDSQQLTDDASQSGRDLYRCEIGLAEGALGCVSLTDISAPNPASGESADVLDQVSGGSDDGTHVYFVARGVLDAAPNDLGDAARSGAPNLYLWREGEGIRYIGTLSEQDDLVWGNIPGMQVGYAELISATVSPSGRFFAFTSNQSLTGYENRNDSDEPTTEAFLYDAEASADKLTCVSCNPSGAIAVGEQVLAGATDFLPDPLGLWRGKWVVATLPEATRTGLVGRSLYRPRAVLDNGRVFFNAVDPLVPADSNGNWDVYQWEPVGVGSCTGSSDGPAVSRSGDGCVGLLSSGSSEGDDGFLDASETGDDVFFLTRGRLSVLDTDEELDVYDARVNGVRAVRRPIQECAGESCQPVTNPPNDPTPSSEAFHGSETGLNCRKGQKRVRRHGKAVCVKKKRAGKHQKKRTSNNGRAGK